MSDPTKHHFIPQFYLSRWADAASGRVSTYSRQRGKLYVREYAPKEIGAEDGLYALEGVPPEMKNMIERDFMAPEIDTPAARSLAILLSKNSAELSFPLRMAWVRFLVSLMIRTPDRVAELSADGAATLRDIITAEPQKYDAIKGVNDPPTLLEFVAERSLGRIFDNFGKSMLTQLIDIPQMNHDIARMDWKVLHYENGPYGLLTCDFPICMSPGLGNPQCLISLPLSPTAVFLAAHKPETLAAIEAQSARKVVDAFNALTARSARRHVYADSRSYHDVVDAELAR